ncbi:hypothetical protein [Schaalia cardiffensis]|uniref:hypothetical protein n=1 Tax=Schaalia cardiffensis TaxID=181487 RepID=UPI0023F0F5C0|nr:hypothetical protein [Schaalia cardiffensis]
MRTVVYLEQIKKGSELRNMLSRHVTWLLIAQVAIVNIGFLVMVYWGALCERWPSDRLVLGWFASTVVEMFALYAIVLRGVFLEMVQSFRIVAGRDDGRREAHFVSGHFFDNSTSISDD